jgi:ribonuclease P protein component
MQRHLRLSRPADFQRLRREGRTYRHRLLILSTATNQLGHNRYGFVVAKRHGHAVQRNRTKRQLREIMRLHDTQIVRGHDIVLIARAGITEQPFHNIQSAVVDLLKEAELLEESRSQ